MQSGEAGSSRIPKTASSVHDVAAEKPPFGSRFLTDEADVWSQNAWDHVPPPVGQEADIAAALTRQKNAPVPEVEKPKYNEKPSRHWDNFYKMNSANFFRNRKWLHLEFPQLVRAAEADAGPVTVAEIGCGAGNAVFPLLSANSNIELDLRAFDYSSHAVKLVQNNPLYLDPPIGKIQAAVWDLSSADLPPGIEEGSIDYIILVFVLSALHPDEWSRAVSNTHKMLKPGGVVLFRDYGRYDLTQLRFKGGRLLEDNFYIRGDKTRVYFFELDELALLFTGSFAPSSAKVPQAIQVIEEVDEAEGNSPTTCGEMTPDPDAGVPTPTLEAEAPFESVQGSVHPSLLPDTNGSSCETLKHPLFAIEQLGVDRRLIVNRKRQLKMYRVWMQAKFKKL